VVGIVWINKKMHCIIENDSVTGPFDLIVGADGVFSTTRKIVRTKNNHATVALIGDARWATDRWWDFGMKRLSKGADMAIWDGIHLGELLIEKFPLYQCTGKLDLGDFGAIRRKKTAFMRLAFASLIALFALTLKIFVYNMSSATFCYET